MWAFETRVSKQRNLSHFLKLFSIALPQNSEDQIAQDPRDVVPAELWSCKWRLRALVTSLSKDPHLHTSLAVLLIPAHVEDHQDTARGPTARAAGAEEPVENQARASAKLWAGTGGRRSLSLAVREMNEPLFLISTWLPIFSVAIVRCLLCKQQVTSLLTPKGPRAFSRSSVCIVHFRGKAHNGTSPHPRTWGS